jgi:hypothetical protein
MTREVDTPPDPLEHRSTDDRKHAHIAFRRYVLGLGLPLGLAGALGEPVIRGLRWAGGLGGPVDRGDGEHGCRLHCRVRSGIASLRSIRARSVSGWDVSARVPRLLGVVVVMRRDNRSVRALRRCGRLATLRSGPRAAHCRMAASGLEIAAARTPRSPGTVPWFALVINLLGALPLLGQNSRAGDPLALPDSVVAPLGFESRVAVYVAVLSRFTVGQRTRGQLSARFLPHDQRDFPGPTPESRGLLERAASLGGLQGVCVDPQSGKCAEPGAHVFSVSRIYRVDPLTIRVYVEFDDSATFLAFERVFRLERTGGRWLVTSSRLGWIT